MPDVKLWETFKIPKLKCVFPSDFTQNSLSKSTALPSSFISSIIFFTFKPNVLNEAIPFVSLNLRLLKSCLSNSVWLKTQICTSQMFTFAEVIRR